MPEYAEPLARLIREFKRLPGIGQKSAQRIAFHVLRAPREDAEQLAQAVLDVKDKLGLCQLCNNISDSELCPYCSNPNRDRSVICVVEEPHNIAPIESTGQFSGLYHVLHGAISPLKGIGPEQLRIKNLIERLQSGEVQELILATNPTVEGEATAAYLSKLIKPLGLKVTRIAMGIPVGSDLEFADEVTLTKSLENRREM
ncbi:MAG TPA: recombination mediator RecR [Bryobacteraceae bacterium]|nr:recombination mediator RecR [Bryobacteraceae bacterium]HOQ45570.1 recombination mediator RecR [Bryobacteraceae bacterium]HPQ16235.1 recombination mediator RecR [Bryobacteraceae bacterium]HPU73392.1 recombination mediator RecR [Bryobacteraceae bacterium]